MGPGFRTFRLTNKVVESDTITSFFLQPTDGAPAWKCKPGQYLTLRIPTTQGDILKTYSVSGDASNTDYHRITVKREAGLASAPDGVGSCWLHDLFEIGDEIQIAAPRGDFFLDETSTRPVLLLSGGVGLTPLVSMLHRLVHSDRDVYFIHACENGQVHALRDELLDLANDRIKVRTVYRHPSTEDQAQEHFDAQGVIDRRFMQQHVSIGDYDAYLCGPTPFMHAMYQLLLELGVSRCQIAYEFFGKASSLDKAYPAETARSQQPVISQAASNAPATIASLAFLTNPTAWADDDKDDAEQPALKERKPLTDQVHFVRSNKTAHWDGSVNSLLELAEKSGLEPEFSCRSGICNSCICRLVEGDVDYFEEPLEQPEQGEVLICCARPKGSVVLDI